MKKIYTIILSAAAILAVAACNKETQVLYETLSVKLGTETKVSLATDATNSAFEEGDQIAVWAGTGAFQTCPVDNSGKITVDITEGARSNYAVYYNGNVAPAFDGSTLTITLPDTYDYTDVSGDKNPVPMVAKNVAGEDGDMTFYAVGALARFFMTGIPATANKIEIVFSRDVTGAFTVTAPGTTAPYISSAEKTTKNIVTINLIPGTDYTGAVFSIPVPVVTVTANMNVKVGDTVLVSLNYVFYEWTATRASGKKNDVHIAVSMKSMVLAPGNLYTDGNGDLFMAENSFGHEYNNEHVYYNSDNYANDASWSINNRTHFNYNETHHLMNGDAITRELAYTNVNSYKITREISGMNWRVPSEAEWTSLTTGTSRPGAHVRNGDSGSFTSGWKFVKVLVSGMGTAGTSNSDGNGYQNGSDYQTGLLLFPDNREITGTFTTLGDKNSKYVSFKTTLITKSALETLIAQGCAFLPAAGWWSSPDGFNYVGFGGAYWSRSPYDANAGYSLVFDKDGVGPRYLNKSGSFGSIRLVRDL